jgi:hypothetical protein
MNSVDLSFDVFWSKPYRSHAARIRDISDTGARPHWLMSMVSLSSRDLIHRPVNDLPCRAIFRDLGDAGSASAGATCIRNIGTDVADVGRSGQGLAPEIASSS